MKKILIINIDSNYRSVYSALIASALIKINKTVQISLVTPGQNEAIASTGLFENVYFLNTADNLTSDSSKDQIVNFLAPIMDINWNYVVNLSADPLAAVFASHLRYEDIFGPGLDANLKNMRHNNLFSRLLSSPKAEGPYPCHFTYLYSSILGLYDEVSPLPSVWKEKDANELTKKINSIKNKQQKNKIIAIDSTLKMTGGIEGVNFFINLYKHIYDENIYLPIILIRNDEEDSYLINKLRDLVQGEIYAMTVSDFSQFCFLSNVDLVITSDLYLKSIADMSLRPSLLLVEEGILPLADFSIHQSSFLIHYQKSHIGLPELVSGLYHQIFENKKLTLNKVKNIQVYKTRVSQSVPYILPLPLHDGDVGGSADFACWWLCLRYLVKLQREELPFFKMDQKLYNRAIQHERESIRIGFNKLLHHLREKGLDSSIDEMKLNSLVSSNGILGICMKHVRSSKGDTFTSGGKLLEHMKPLVEGMLEFLSSEESRGMESLPVP